MGAYMVVDMHVDEMDEEMYLIIIVAMCSPRLFFMTLKNRSGM